MKGEERLRNLKALAISTSELEKLLTETKDIETIKLLYKKWIADYDKTLEAHDHYQKLILVEEEKSIDSAWFKEKMNKFLQLNKMVQQYFALHQTANPVVKQEHDDSKSRVSHNSGRSQDSRRSYRSSTASNLSAARLKEEQRKAELLTRAKFLADKKQLEEQKLKLRMQEEELDIKTELNVSG